MADAQPGLAGQTPTRVGEALVIVLEGGVTGAACPGLRDTVLRRLPKGVNHVLIDASAVTAIDDAVFSVMLAGGAWLRIRGGRIGFLSASASVRRSLAALGLSSLLPVLGRHAADAVTARLADPPLELHISLPESRALLALQAVAPPQASYSPQTALLPAQRTAAESPVAVAL